MIRHVSIAIAGLLLGTVLVFSCFSIGVATVHADSTPALLDAGSSSGSAVAAPLPTALPDPMSDPAGFLATLEAAKTHGWPFALMLGLVGLLELAASAGKRFPKFAWLGKGRVSVVIAGATTILLAGVAVLLHAGTWGAALVAIGSAGLAYWHQAGTDPAKA